ncbi:hypothetical protein VKT23_017909 [Stygiomarasmius scandens]|uniref:Uncharacterized protein n=1 Tax=Marasmiellus scandens TaxID=2682957 RepID=A0ABR1IQN7_9AGAR
MNRLSFWSQNSLGNGNATPGSTESGYHLNPPISVTAWSETQAKSGSRSGYGSSSRKEEGGSGGAGSSSRYSGTSHSPWVSRPIRQQHPFSNHNSSTMRSSTHTATTTPLDNSSYTMPPSRHAFPTANANYSPRVESMIPGLYPTRRAPLPPTSPSPHSRSFPRSISRLVLLALPLPLFPLLALLFMITGHAIFRAAHSSEDVFHTASIISSCKSGVVGGAILAIPFSLFLYLLYPSSSSTSNNSNSSTSYPAPDPSHPSFAYHSTRHQAAARPTSAEDFFEDEDSVHSVFPCQCLSLSPTDVNAAQILRYTLVILVFTLAVGTASGPLGYAIWHAVSSERYTSTTMLSGSDAAEAGVIGGAVIGPALGILCLMLWVCFGRRGES